MMIEIAKRMGRVTSAHACATTGRNKEGVAAKAAIPVRTSRLLGLLPEVRIHVRVEGQFIEMLNIFQRIEGQFGEVHFGLP